MIKVIGIRIIDRIKEAGLTQSVLSKYSSIISTRLGFHELSTSSCSREAFLLLHLSGGKPEIAGLTTDLRELIGIDIREMVFDDNLPFTNFRSEEGSLRILGILIEKKEQETVSAVQKILTSYGCIIKTRLGVNEEFLGNPAGLILTELVGDEIQMDLLEKDLQKQPKLVLRKIAF